MKKKMGGSNGGMGGMPGVKKNKEMNSYANGGAVKVKTRGTGAATRGTMHTDLDPV